VAAPARRRRTAGGPGTEDAGAIEAAMQALFMDGLAGQCLDGAIVL